MAHRSDSEDSGSPVDTPEVLLEHPSTPGPLPQQSWPYPSSSIGRFIPVFIDGNATDSEFHEGFFL